MGQVTIVGLLPSILIAVLGYFTSMVVCATTLSTAIAFTFAQFWLFSFFPIIQKPAYKKRAVLVCDRMCYLRSDLSNGSGSLLPVLNKIASLMVSFLTGMS